MSDDPKKTDWSRVTDAAAGKTLPELVPTGPGAVAVRQAAAETTGIVQQLKEGKIRRRAAVEALQKTAEVQLDVLSHQLQEAARVKKTEATVLAEQLLKGLDLQFQQVLSELGLRNEAIRAATLKKLNDQTAKELKEFTNKDWPDFMREASIKLVTERWQKFIHRLSQDVEEESD